MRTLSFLLLCTGTLLAESNLRTLVTARLQFAGGTNPERAEKLRKLFAEEGCAASEQIAVKGSPPNLICTVPGSTQDIILVGAHFDAVKGAGAADNWSGASLLPTLYREVKARSPKHTFVFVGFTEEEKGLLGSRQFVNELTLDRRRATKAMVNIDTLGLDVPNVWVSKADEKLSFLAAIAASEVPVHLSAVEMGRSGTTDSESFEGTGIPRITFSSVRPATMKLLHGKRDTLESIRMDDYLASFFLLNRFLLLLDAR